MISRSLFLKKEKMQPFVHFPGYVLFIDCVAKSEKNMVKFSCLPNFRGYEDHEISFQTFFVWALLLIVHT